MPGSLVNHYIRPVSAGFVVPVFAFLPAGVVLGVEGLGVEGLGATLSDRVILGVIAGLVVGKFLGVFGGAWPAVRLGLARLSEELRWRDTATVSILAGIGFTVSLLIGNLAYGDDPERVNMVTTGVLVASLIASLLAAILLRVRVRKRLKAQDDI